MARSGSVIANTNGKLIATYEQFHRFWAWTCYTAAAAQRQLKALGFVEVKEGCAGNADERQPNLFRLTFLPAEGTPSAWSAKARVPVGVDFLELLAGPKTDKLAF